MTVKDILKSRRIRNFVTNMMDFLPNRPYIKLYYWATTGKRLNLKNPTGFNEKLNWLKLHGDYSRYVDYCDKIKVRKIIEEKLGDGYLFPLLGQWKTFDEIDFDSLPEEFVLKCNHDSGSTKIIRGKSKLKEREWAELKAFFDRCVKYDFYRAGREPCYKGIKPYIIAEELMKDSNNDPGGIKDYKFFCFDGTPAILFVATDRSTDVRFDFFDMDFNHLDIVNIHPQSGKTLEKPSCFEEMKEIVYKLSEGIKFVRIDLYEIDGKVHFGEYTFFHGGGFNVFEPEEWEQKLGALINIG